MIPIIGEKKRGQTPKRGTPATPTGNAKGITRHYLRSLITSQERYSGSRYGAKLESELRHFGLK